MKILIIDVSEKNSIDAHARNCLELNKIFNERKFNSKVIFLSETKEEKEKDYDVIIISYASFYADFKSMKRIIEENKNAKLFWVTNEYDLMPNGSLYKIFKDNASCICNFEDHKSLKSCFKNIYSLNLNLLLFDEEERKINKKYDLVYYGTFRKNRTKYFKKYFDKNIYISTSKKNCKKFSIFCKDIKFINKMNWDHKKETLNLFRYSLYIEDEKTHDNFNNLANRFYEALKTNTVIFFDRSCLNTVIKAGLKNYEDFIIDNKEDLNNKINNGNFEYYLKIQREWKEQAIEEKKDMIEEFINIIRS